MIQNFYGQFFGNYATDKGVKLRLDISNGTSREELAHNTDFKLWDLNFKITGEYSNIVEFLYKIEGDERLVARISNFTLAPEGSTTVAEDSRNTRQTESTPTASSASTLVATFTVKGVPINTKGFDPNIVDPLANDKPQTQLTEEEKIRNEAQKVNNNGSTTELKNATQTVVAPNSGNNTSNSSNKKQGQQERKDE